METLLKSLINEAIGLINEETSITPKSKKQLVDYLTKVLTGLDGKHTDWTKVIGRVKETIIILGALGSVVGGLSPLILAKDKLEESIEYALSYPAELKNKVEHFISDTHPYVDGKSSQRVLAAADELLVGKNVAKKNKPLNLLRRFKMRKKLNYWKL